MSMRVVIRRGIKVSLCFRDEPSLNYTELSYFPTALQSVVADLCHSAVNERLQDTNSATAASNEANVTLH